MSVEGDPGNTSSPNDDGLGIPTGTSDEIRTLNSESSTTTIDTDKITMNVAQETPFLVTHWLSEYEMRYSPQGTNEEGFEARQDALKRIRRAASELASAFSAIGAYGTTSKVRNFAAASAEIGLLSTVAIASFGD
jgi:hypothetical protein